MNIVSLLPFVKQIAILFPTFILLFTVRGFAKALTARLAGDDSPMEDGFLTINPLAHIDPIGTFLIAALFSLSDQLQSLAGGFITIGIVFAIVFIGIRPYYPVTIDRENFKHPRLGIALTTLSVPLGYLFLALMSLYAIVWGHYFLVYLLAMPSGFLVIQQVSECVLQWSLFWALISLIPLPPFEAASLLPVFFGEAGQTLVDVLERYTLFIFCGLFFLPGLSTWVLYGLNLGSYYLNQLLINFVILPPFYA